MVGHWCPLQNREGASISVATVGLAVDFLKLHSVVYLIMQYCVLLCPFSPTHKIGLGLKTQGHFFKKTHLWKWGGAGENVGGYSSSESFAVPVVQNVSLVHNCPFIFCWI